MTPQTIMAVLDNKLPRNEHKGQVTWAGRRGQKFAADIDRDGQALRIAYNIRPGVWLEKETKFARPYGALK